MRQLWLFQMQSSSLATKPFRDAQKLLETEVFAEEDFCEHMLNYSPFNVNDVVVMSC